MKKYFAILAIAMVAVACAGKQETKAPEAAPATEQTVAQPDSLQQPVATPDSTNQTPAAAM